MPDDLLAEVEALSVIFLLDASVILAALKENEPRHEAAVALLTDDTVS